MAVGDEAVFHQEAVVATDAGACEALNSMLQAGEASLLRKSLGRCVRARAPAPLAAPGALKDPASPDELEGTVKTLSREEKDYFALQTPELKRELVERLAALRRTEAYAVPLRFRVLLSELPPDLKRRIAQKLEKQQDTLASGDAVKYSTWVETLLALPLNVYHLAPPEPGPDVCAQLGAAAAHLDAVVYGHRAAKQAILERLFQWLAYPWVPQRPLGLQGCPGNGKSSLIREGLAKLMQRPYCFVALGGSFDSSYLLGHSYTYEGSVGGRITEALTTAGCMNPLIFFDEVDKCSSTPKGEEIVNVLVHLTDTTQNSHFRDRYCGALDLDVSRALLVFAFNSSAQLSPVLLDRLQVVATESFDAAAQLQIVKQHLLPRILADLGRGPDFLTIAADALQEILHACGDGGVRLLRSVLEQTVCKVGIYDATGSAAFVHPLHAGDIVKRGPQAYELRGGLGRLLAEASAAKQSRHAAPPGMYA